MKITSPGRSLIASARPIYAVWPVCPHTPRYIWGELTSTSGFCKAAAGAAHENGVQSQKENIHYHALLYVRPTRKRLMAREETNPTSCLEEAPKPPRFLEFPSSGGANIDTNHMLLVHDIGQFKAGRVTLFHHDIVPSCASARENSREGVPPGKGSPFGCQRGILCGYFIVILHSTVKRSLPPFAPGRLRHSLHSMKSKALISKFRYQTVVCRNCRNRCLN